MEEAVRSQLPLKPVEFLVLAVLQHGPVHGYGIVRRIDRHPDGAVKVRAADLYRVLYRLVERGLLEPVDSPMHDGRQERRTYCAVTELGDRVLKAEAELLSGIIERVTGSA